MNNTIDKIIKQIVEEEGGKHSYDQIHKAIWHTFKSIRKTLKDRQMPKILIKGFGSFIVTPIRVRKSLTNLEERYKRGEVEEEEYIKEKARFESIIKRRSKEWGSKTYGRIY